MPDRNLPAENPISSISFDADIHMFHAVSLVHQAADVILALERWKNTIEPQVAVLIRRFQKERRQWAHERTQLLDDLGQCRQKIEVIEAAFGAELSEKLQMSEQLDHMRARIDSLEIRALLAEDMLFRLREHSSA